MCNGDQTSGLDHHIFLSFSLRHNYNSNRYYITQIKFIYNSFAHQTHSHSGSVSIMNSVKFTEVAFKYRWKYKIARSVIRIDVYEMRKNNRQPVTLSTDMDAAWNVIWKFIIAFFFGFRCFCAFICFVFSSFRTVYVSRTNCDNTFCRYPISLSSYENILMRWCVQRESSFFVRSTWVFDFFFFAGLTNSFLRCFSSASKMN